jgi:GrpB-like predicted nucleotidyltransferase (UPF0157 family)
VAELELAEYDAARVDRFHAEAHLVTDALGDLVRQIEHVGSTAVPGLAGKPTVDIAVGVETLELPPGAIERMGADGFRFQEDETRPWERRFVKGDEFPRAVIVHVVEWLGPKWRELIRFRDALRTDPSLAAEYEDLKRSLLERGRWYRGVDKQDLIERVLAG